MESRNITFIYQGNADVYQEYQVPRRSAFRMYQPAAPYSSFQLMPNYEKNRSMSSSTHNSDHAMAWSNGQSFRPLQVPNVEQQQSSFTQAYGRGIKKTIEFCINSRYIHYDIGRGLNRKLVFVYSFLLFYSTFWHLTCLSLIRYARAFYPFIHSFYSYFFHSCISFGYFVRLFIYSYWLSWDRG